MLSKSALGGFLSGMIVTAALLLVIPQVCAPHVSGTGPAAAPSPDPTIEVTTPTDADGVRPAAAPRSLDAPDPVQHRYPFKLLRVIDGDTMDGEWSIWADTHRTGRLRLLGVNTPELHPRTGTPAEREAEKAAALAAKAYVETALTGAKSITLVTDWADDSFGRILAGVLYRDAAGVDHDLAQDLLATGHARPFEE